MSGWLLSLSLECPDHNLLLCFMACKCFTIFLLLAPAELRLVCACEIGNQCKESLVLSSRSLQLWLTLSRGKSHKRFYDSMLVRSWCWCLMLIIKNLLRNFHHQQNYSVSANYIHSLSRHSLVNDFSRFVFAPSSFSAAGKASLGSWNSWKQQLSVCEKRQGRHRRVLQ